MFGGVTAERSVLRNLWGTAVRNSGASGNRYERTLQDRLRRRCVFGWHLKTQVCWGKAQWPEVLLGQFSTANQGFVRQLT